jgi:hypothetical protein
MIFIIYYEGGGNDKITIGRNMGWGALASFNLNGNVFMSGSVGLNTKILLSRLTVRMSYSDGNTRVFCIDCADASNTYNLSIFSYVQAGCQVGYNFQVRNIASSVNAITLNYDDSVNIGTNATVTNNRNCGTLQIGGSECKFVNGGTNGPGTPSTNNQWYKMS